MPETTHINFPQKGISSDLSVFNTGDPLYTFALNSVDADKDGQEPALQNEMSNLCAVQFPTDYRVVGKREIPEQDRVIYMLHNTVTGMDQIGEVHNCANIKDRTDRIERVYCKDCPEYEGKQLTPLEKQAEKCYCEYRSLTQSTCLGFSVDYPVDIEYRITSCSLDIFFTDALNERRFIYFGYENNDVTGNLEMWDIFKVQTGVEGGCDTPVYSDDLDCNKIKVQPDYDRVCVDFINFTNGGQLKAGDYQVLVAYSDANGNAMTHYTPATQIIPLFKKQITIETNYSTASALHFKLTNLQTNNVFLYYNIVVAETIDNFTQFKYVGTFPTSQAEYTYTGFENTIKVLSAQEVTFRYPYYQTAKGVTKANDILFYSGVKSYKHLNLQPIANAITLHWQTVALKEGAYKDPRNTFNFRTEQRDEVVPYGVVFEFTNGEETCAFHIPGRSATDDDLEEISTDNPDYIGDYDCTTSAPKPKWKIYNTASVTGTPHDYNPDCETNRCWEYGEFAYWESTDTYPNIPEIWGDLCNKPIRHHKFPDSCISHIHDGQDASKVYNENNYIFPIGVQIDHTSVVNAIAQAVTDGVITQADADRIKSYRVVRGNRLGNKSIIAKGLFYNMWFYDRDSIRYYYPNYAYNDLRQDYYIAPSNNFGGSNTSDPDPVQPDHVAQDRYTFHSPDTSFTQPELGTYVKIETEEYGQTEGYFTHSDCQAKYKLLSEAARVLAFGLGVAAALSATSATKECRTVTYKSDYLNTPGNDHNDSQTFNTGQNITGTETGVWVGTTNGTLTGTITTTNAGGSLGGYDTSHDTGTETHNHQIAPVFDPTTGFPLPDIQESESYTKTYCRGKEFQIFNSDVLINTILGTIGTTGIIIQKVILGIIEMNKVLDTMKELIPYINYGVQYNSVGKYNNYFCVAEGNKNRTLLRTAYLEPILQAVDETSTTPDATSTTIKINNWHRESSVYLKLGGTTLVDPTTVDTSRFTMSNIGLAHSDLEQRVNATISSYYGSIKRDIPNQYGQICNIEYLEAGNCSFFLDQEYDPCEVHVFGGDTYINRFSFKRKMPFWLQTRCGFDNNSDVKYSELSNVGYPNYYFDSEEPLIEKLSSLSGGLSGIVADLLGTANSRLDDRLNKFFYQEGYMYLYNYGVPSFIVESDVNLDYRHGENDKDRDFYPHQTDLKYWFEEKNVPIATDNSYIYNRTYSKQNHETPICAECIKYFFNLQCTTTDDNLVIYSEPDGVGTADNWLIFKANNRTNFPLTLGKLIGIDGIENDKVLVRFENTFQIFNAYNTIEATPENIQVGTGGIFASRPQEYSSTTLGYSGTQHTDINHSEFGHVWGDARRGAIFNLAPGGGSVDEISKYGTFNWFKENLKFQLKKDFSNIPQEDLDNNLKGIGLHYCFDKRYNRLLVTKLDYKVLNHNVRYDNATHTFYIPDGETNVEVRLTDPRYFCNKSWTRSYSFLKKEWRSFHTYLPNWYVQHVDNFETGITRFAALQPTSGLGFLFQETDNEILLEEDDNIIDTEDTKDIITEDSAFDVITEGLDALLIESAPAISYKQSTYIHNISNKSYQVFYGKLQPWIIELVGKQSTDNNFMESFSYSLDAIRYHNEFDQFYNNNVTFNKAIIYNERQCTGQLNLIPNNHDDLSQLGLYPTLGENGFEILATNSENLWSFNGFYDVARSNIPFLRFDCANVNKKLDLRAIDYHLGDFNQARIRAKNSRIRLIQDKTSQFKLVFNFGITQQEKSVR